MLGNTFYHGTIKKTIISFGRLFSDIKVERRAGDTINGDIVQTISVPITYAPKEKWVARLEQDPNLDQHVATILPRMSFEITGYTFDNSRKLPKTNRITCSGPNGGKGVFTPVPYNLDISLYIFTKTQEDGLQILEQILPVFVPEYTMSISAIPSMNIIQDVPVILGGVSLSDEYEGDFSTRRLVTHTLSFTLKINLFGPIREPKPIYTSTANINNMSDGSIIRTFTAKVEDDGDISEEWIDGL